MTRSASLKQNIEKEFFQTIGLTWFLYRNCSVGSLFFSFL